MSDTPRTNEKQRNVCVKDCGDTWLVPADFARQLERELNEAKEQLVVLSIELNNEKQRSGLLVGFKDTANRNCDRKNKLIKQMLEAFERLSWQKKTNELEEGKEFADYETGWDFLVDDIRETYELMEEAARKELEP